MSDLTPSGAAHGARLSNTVAREIIVVQIMLRRLGSKPVDNLFISDRAERGDGEHLCLTSCKESGAMRARQNTNLTADRAHLIKRTAVRTDLLVRDHMTDDPLFDLIENLRNFLRCVRIFLDEMLNGF